MRRAKLPIRSLFDIDSGENMNTEATVYGEIRQVTGPVVDVAFPAGSVPGALTALRVTNPLVSDKEWNTVLEVSLHLGEGVVRAIAMDSTDGLTRGAKVKNTGDMITVPVGREVLGRILNVTGTPVDGVSIFQLKDGTAVRGTLDSESDTAYTVKVRGTTADTIHDFEVVQVSKTNIEAILETEATPRS